MIVLLFVSLHGPLLKAADAVAERLSKATKFSAWKFSFEVEQAAAAIGYPQLGKLIGGLSPEALEKLMNTAHVSYSWAGRSAHPEIITLPGETETRVLEELRAKKLLAFSKDPVAYRQFVAGLPLAPLEYGAADRREYRLNRPPTPQEQQRLEAQTYSLIPLGLKAFDLIVQVIRSGLEESGKSAAGPER